MPPRPPAVAGLFYPKDPEALRRDVDRFLKIAPKPALGLVAPHAGYTYSGATAGIAFGSVEVTPTVIVLSPNHTGMGPPISIYPEGSWQTPAGEIRIDAAMTRRVFEADPDVEPETAAHEQEHGIEVEIPFILRRNPAAQLVAIVVGTQEYAAMKRLGDALDDAVARAGKPVLIVASSDMNHFEDDATTRAKDRRAIERLAALDPRGLDEVCRRERISMCGRAPAVAMLLAMKLEAGKGTAELLDHRTSADAGGETERCVGYAAMRFTR